MKQNNIHKNIIFGLNQDFFIACFLTVPILLKVLLPSGIETNLTPSLFGVYIFLPNLFMLFFLIKSEKNRGLIWIKLLFFLQVISAFLSFVFNDYVGRWVVLFSGTFYFIGIFIALNCHINDKQRKYVGLLTSLGVLALDIEVLLVSTGLFTTYNGYVLTGVSAGSFLRIHTTAGATTATACIIYGMTMISILLLNNNKLRYIVFVSGMVATFLTISRGGIVAFLFYVFLLLFHSFRKNFQQSLKPFFTVFFIFVVVYYLGLFDAIIERNSYLINSSYGITSGRDYLIEQTLQDFKQNGDLLFGVGISNVFPSIELRLALNEGVRLMHENIPHNSYILVLAELGWVGFIIFVLFWVCVLIKIHKNYSAFYALLPIVLVLFNTETVVMVDSEIMFINTILLMLAFDKKRMEQLCDLHWREM